MYKKPADHQLNNLGYFSFNIDKNFSHTDIFESVFCMVSSTLINECPVSYRVLGERGNASMEYHSDSDFESCDGIYYLTVLIWETDGVTNRKLAVGKKIGDHIEEYEKLDCYSHDTKYYNGVLINSSNIDFVHSVVGSSEQYKDTSVLTHTYDFVLHNNENNRNILRFEKEMKF